MNYTVIVMEIELSITGLKVASSPDHASLKLYKATSNTFDYRRSVRASKKWISTIDLYHSGTQSGQQRG